MRPFPPTDPASPPSRRFRTTIPAALLAALLLVPALAVPAQDWTSEMERELAVERTCEDWQKVRRCADADGELQYECVAKSPLAKFLSFFRGERQEDDEVRVIRKAPEPQVVVPKQHATATANSADTKKADDEADDDSGQEENAEEAAASRRSSTADASPSPSPSPSSSPSAGASPAAGDAADETDGRYRKVRVKKSDLPPCRDSR